MKPPKILQLVLAVEAEETLTDTFAVSGQCAGMLMPKCTSLKLLKHKAYFLQWKKSIAITHLLYISKVISTTFPGCNLNLESTSLQQESDLS